MLFWSGFCLTFSTLTIDCFSTAESQTWSDTPSINHLCWLSKHSKLLLTCFFTIVRVSLIVFTVFNMFSNINLLSTIDMILTWYNVFVWIMIWESRCHLNRFLCWGLFNQAIFLKRTLTYFTRSWFLQVRWSFRYINGYPRPRFLFKRLLFFWISGCTWIWLCSPCWKLAFCKAL